MRAKSPYKVPWHVRQYVKQELLDYRKNKKLIKNYKGSTRSLLLAEKRLAAIDHVLNKLNKEDEDAAICIFFDKYSQAGAEIAKGISKATYYNAMNKVIYLVAEEMELI